MPKFTLTKADESLTSLPDGWYDNSTKDLIEYGLRDGCIQSEYDLANRLQQMRELALQLITALAEEGLLIHNDDLKLIDVEIEINSMKRLTL